MYRARSLPAAWNTGSASPTSASSLSVAIARSRGPLCEGTRAPERVASPTCLEQGVDDVDLEGDVELGRGHKRDGALEQAHGGGVVLPELRPAAGGGQAPPRRRGQLFVGRHPELGSVAAGLLEVVAEDLVQLDELGAVLLEPGCEALVQLGAGRLGQRVVSGVADQQVAEAEAVLAYEVGLVRPDQLLAHERGQARSHVGLVGCERLHGAAVEDLTLDRAPLEHAPLGRLELIEARREQRLQGGRDDHLALYLVGHRQHLPDEERVAARRASDLLAQLTGDPLRDQLVDV